MARRDRRLCDLPTPYKYRVRYNARRDSWVVLERRTNRFDSQWATHQEAEDRLDELEQMEWDQDRQDEQRRQDLAEESWRTDVVIGCVLVVVVMIALMA